ncbi:MAG: hypothetical protein ACI4WG_06840 [Erysipelotrichaceae bacterium]
MKKLMICLLTALLACGMLGCSDKYEGLTKVEKEDYTIYVPDSYVEEETEEYSYIGYNENSFLSIFYEEISYLQQFIDISDDITLEEYAELLQQSNELEDPFVKDKNGNLLVEYEVENAGVEYYYCSTVKKGNNKFYVLTCACLIEDSEELKDDFSRWFSTFTPDKK